MTLLSKTFLVEGRNHKILLEKLKNAKINALKIEILSEKLLKITIDAKDTAKYFAICKNSWYNKDLGTSGVLSPFYHMVKNWIISLSIVSFFAVAFFANGIYFESEYRGDALLYRSTVEKEFEKAGIKKYSFFSQEKLNAVRQTLEKQSGIAFISIKKSGNKAIIDLKSSQTPPQGPFLSSEDLIAKEDMVILNITVYSGTACVEKGQAVKKGEVIAKASHFFKEEEVKTLLYCEITAECVFEYLYQSKSPIDGTVKNNAFASAKFALGDYPVRSFEFEQLKGDCIKVILKYEKRIS